MKLRCAQFLQLVGVELTEHCITNGSRLMNYSFIGVNSFNRYSNASSHSEIRNLGPRPKLMWYLTPRNWEMQGPDDWYYSVHYFCISSKKKFQLSFTSQDYPRCLPLCFFFLSPSFCSIFISKQHERNFKIQCKIEICNWFLMFCLYLSNLFIWFLDSLSIDKDLEAYFTPSPCNGVMYCFKCYLKILLILVLSGEG